MTAAIRADRLVKRYRGMDHDAIHGLSFEIEPGSIIGLLGPNGAGKTTITKLICGVTLPTEGSVAVFGAAPTADGGRPKLDIGVVHQSAPFDMMLSVLDNLKIAAASRGLRWRRVRDRVDDFLDLFGLAGMTGQLTFTLSGGEQRRLQIIRALLGMPRLLILDEPSAGLDAAARRQVWALIEGLRREQDTTVVWTSHYIEELERNCDRVLILARGRLAGFATPQDLTAQFGNPTAVIGTTSRDDLERLAAVIRCRGLAATCVRDQVEVTGPAVREQLPSILADPQVQGVEITAVEFRRPSLEDAFLDLVETIR